MAKFSKYLPRSGWTPLVVAGEIVKGRPTDTSLAEEVRDVAVTRTPARSLSTAIAALIRPLKALRSPGGGPGGPSNVAGVIDARPSLSGRIARWLAVPDDAAYWIGPASREAVRIGRSEKARVVLASGPPFSVTVAGARSAAQLGLPFVVDMRDHWRDNPAAYWPTTWHERRSAKLERRVLAAADMVLAVSEPIAAEARSMGARDARVLPNGFDPDDLPARQPDPAGPLRVAFMGKVYYGHSDPTAFLRAMVHARESGIDVTLDFVGSRPAAVEETVRALGLADVVEFHGYMPHRSALELVARADMGLVLIDDRPGAKASVTGKLFEYLGMGLPVLVVGPTDGAAAQLVNTTGGGFVAKSGDVADISRVLLDCVHLKRAGKPLGCPDAEEVGRYGRPDQAAELARVLDAVSLRREELA